MQINGVTSLTDISTYQESMNHHKAQEHKSIISSGKGKMNRDVSYTL